MSKQPEGMHVLQMIEDGKISAVEGLRLLDAMAEPVATDTLASANAGDGPPAAASAPADPGLNRWRRWWIIPAYIGTATVVVSALLMYLAYSAGGFSLWFGCASLPFSLGVLVLALAAGSRSARWLHLRVKTGQDEWPRNIAISFPLPIRLTAWALRTSGQFIPHLTDRGVDELIMAVADNTSAESPLYLDVQEGDGGEQVQVYIG